ncbi:MAG: hypothetical protein M5U12_22675 [Verrucomicrobia bacterium]|nr:hypothetical protein [Verrucomicrobiota bacterium]
MLEAVAEPSNEPAVRAALGTRLLGLTAAAVQNLEEDEAGWRDWLERLHAYRTRWVHQGFGRMFRALLREQAITERLLGQPDGVRRITNLLHLAGLLGSAADAGHLQIRGLLRWLVARRDDEQAPPEEHLLRLERDDDAVRLLTAHASKGLQYPVVFCPYLQKPALPARQGKQREHVVYHRADESSEMVLDLRWQPDEASLQRSRRERLAEAVRLLYVALTRAEHRCYFAWGRRFEQRSGGPAWVFLRPEPAEPDPAGTLHRAVEKQGLDKIQARLQTLADQQPGSIQVEALPEVLGDVVPPAVPEPAGPAEKPALAPLVFTRQLDRAWGISSFSSLASAGSRGASDHADLPILPEAESEPAVDPLKEFGAGARLGECVHEILETWLMAPSVGPSLEAVAARKLAKFDLGGNGSSARLAEVLRRALDIELPGVGGARFRLSDVPVGDRLAEVKFHLPLRRITPDRLAACFEGGVGSACAGGVGRGSRVAAILSARGLSHGVD